MAEQICANCRRGIPAASYQLHVVHCARNITLCKACDEPIPRAEYEEHVAEECPARLVECSLCGARVAASKLEDHKENACKKRTTLCKWCATHVEMGNLEEHEDYCGSRTEKCEKCEEFIMLKNFEGHVCMPPWEKKLAERRRPSIVTPSTTYTSSYSARSNYSSELTRSSSRSNFSSSSAEASRSQETYTSRYSSSASSSAIGRSTSSSLVTAALNKSATTERVNTSQETASTTTTNHNSNNNSSLTSYSKSIGSEEAVMIPCEFCDQPISSTKLLSHQAECVSPNNVRSGASSRYTRAASITRSTRAASITRSTSYSLASTASSSRVNKYLSQEQETTASAKTDSNSSSRKISPTSTNGNSSSIVSRFISSPESKTNGHERKVLPDSPPSYEKDYSSSSYVGRSSYLKEESRREEARRQSSSSVTKTSRGVRNEAPGGYDNDQDREGLRQMLSSLRRDPMDVEDDPDNNDGTFFPCEFCGDPYPCEFLMRHQISCDLNPQPVSSGSGFDYSAIKRSIGDTLTVPETNSRRRPSANAGSVTNGASGSGESESYNSSSRESRRMSRSNSVIERSYSRSNIRASSVSRTSSFADRSYGTRTNLARQSSFTLQDYSSAARRSSIFDGVAGYSIYSSISEGLDQITYGGRTSRRNSVSESTAPGASVASGGYSLSRQGSFSTRSNVPISALMASMEASKVSREESTTIANDHINTQAKAYLQNGPSNGFSRQSSRNETVDSPFGVANSRHMNGAAEIQKSESSHNSNLRRRSSLKHSESGYKLERKVSFHHRDQIIGDSSKSMIVDENGVPVEGEKKEKKKRTKEEKEIRRREKDEKRARKEAKRAAREMSVTRSASEQMPAPAVMAVNSNNGVKTHVQGEQLLEQVSAKLVNHLQESGASTLFPEQGVQASRKQPAQAANTSASLTSDQSRTQAKTTSSNPHDTDHKQLTKLEAGGSERPRKGPPPQPPVVSDLVCLEDTEAGPSSVVLREHNNNTELDSRNCSKRNSLDNKSVATLAKDLAAECAKAYELMESSLSKLTNDFSIGPFGLTPKTKKKFRGPPAPPLT